MAINGFTNFIDCAALKIYALPEATIEVTNGIISKTLSVDDVFEIKTGWKIYIIYIEQKNFGTWTISSIIENIPQEKTIIINNFQLYTISLMLPNEYEQIEYIQSSGTQQINTGISPLTTRWGFEIDFTPLNSITNTGYAIFGTQISGHEWHLNCWTGGTSRLGTLIMNATSYDAGLIQNTRIQCELHNLLYKSSTGKVAAVVDASVNNLPLYLFCKNNNGTLQENSSMRLYSFRLYDDEDNMVLNLIPGIRKSDSVTGLWDCVSETFFTNVGTGTFTAGSRIDIKNPPLYLYNYGNNNLITTGGLQTYAYRINGSSLTPAPGILSKTNTNITFSHSSSSSVSTLFINNKIDLTNFSTIKINVTASQGTEFMLRTTLNKTNNYVTTANITKTGGTTGIIALDIASLTGEQYVFLAINGSSPSITFNDWWVE